MEVRRRTAEESRAYVQGFCDSFNKYNEYLREHKHISEAYNKMRILTTTMCKVLERWEDDSNT